MKTRSRSHIGRPVDRTLPERRREEILIAATRFFARHGYLNADIEILAAELGVGKGTIYRYFKNKEQLFKSALLRGLSGLHEAVSAATSDCSTGKRPQRDSLDLVCRAIITYLAYFDHHPDVIELMVLERAELASRGKPTYFSHRDRYLGPWRARLRRLMASGQIRRMDVDVITSSLSMLLYGALVTHPFLSEQRSLAAQARGVLDIVVNGIRGNRRAQLRTSRRSL